MKHTLMTLPYPMDALEPFLTQETLFYHHEKHHAGYVNKLNALIAGTEYEDMQLEAIIKKAEGAILNNAAQTFNHNFYWNSLTNEKTNPSEALLTKLVDTFGSMQKFKEEFLDAALNNFGSGWTWLIVDAHGALKILNTSNAQTPIRGDDLPLLTCDVWEHAYYIDYRNERAKYLEGFWEHVNWENVSKIFEATHCNK